MNKLAYSMKEAVAATGLSRSTLYEAIAAGRLKTRKAGTKTLIRADDLASFIDALPQGGGQ